MPRTEAPHKYCVVFTVGAMLFNSDNTRQPLASVVDSRLAGGAARQGATADQTKESCVVRRAVGRSEPGGASAGQGRGPPAGGGSASCLW